MQLSFFPFAYESSVEQVRMPSHGMSELSVVSYSWISEQACSVGLVELDFEKGFFLLLFLGIL